MNEDAGTEINSEAQASASNGTAVIFATIFVAACCLAVWSDIWYPPVANIIQGYTNN